MSCARLIIFKVYLLASTLLWAALLIGIIPNQSRIWHPYIGSWTLSLLTDCILLLLTRDKSRVSTLDTVQTSLQSVRVLLLLVLVGSGFAFALSDCCASNPEVTNQDTEPLLTPETSSTKNQVNGSYGSVSQSDDEASDVGSDDDDDPKHTKELKKKQQERLSERGSWLAYLKDFRVLLPLIWPSDNRFVMGCSAVLMAILLADRALNVLVPRLVLLESRQPRPGHFVRRSSSKLNAFRDLNIQECVKIVADDQKITGKWEFSLIHSQQWPEQVC